MTVQLILNVKDNYTLVTNADELQKCIDAVYITQIKYNSECNNCKKIKKNLIGYKYFKGNNSFRIRNKEYSKIVGVFGLYNFGLYHCSTYKEISKENFYDQIKEGSILFVYNYEENKEYYDKFIKEMRDKSYVVHFFLEEFVIKYYLIIKNANKNLRNVNSL